MKSLRVWIVASLAVANARAQAVNTRYELAWRLRELDRVWSQRTNLDLRAQVIDELVGAAKSQAAGNLGDATRELDVARKTLNGERAVSPDGLAIQPHVRLFDRGETKLALVFDRVYGERDQRDWSVSLSSPQTTDGLSESGEISFDAPTDSWSANVGKLRVGDQLLMLDMFDGDFDSHWRRVSVSIVERRDERLAALEKGIAELPETAPQLERETAKALLALLKSLARGSTEETDYPAARLLGECEQVVAAAAKDERWYGAARAGEFWLALPSRTRLFVPSGLKPEVPTPLVIALHGEGGSENTFFDGYGDGAIVRECARRGWLLVAPRLEPLVAAPLDEIIAALAERYPVDRARMCLVGYSQGADAAIAASVGAPKMFRALAVLGGGRELEDAGALKGVPIFVGAGEFDVDRAGCEQLHASLIAADAKKATLEIYPACEHLMIVADALPDAFRFFDDAVAMK